MKYTLEISIKAHIDTLDAVDYYDKIDTELGTRFLTELSDIYVRLTNNPQYYSLISSNPRDKFRDIKLRSFPYVVIFEIYEPVVAIISIMNTHAKPFIS